MTVNATKTSEAKVGQDTLLDLASPMHSARALRASEERYRRIIETANEGVWVFDANLCTTFVNRKMADMLGYSPEEMVGNALFLYLAEEERAEAVAGVQRSKQGLAGQVE